jgi:hypothetical protein
VQPAPFSFNESSLTGEGDRGKKEGRFLEQVGRWPADAAISGFVQCVALTLTRTQRNKLPVKETSFIYRETGQLRAGWLQSIQLRNQLLEVIENESV